MGIEITLFLSMSTECSSKRECTGSSEVDTKYETEKSSQEFSKKYMYDESVKPKFQVKNVFNPKF